MKCAINKLALPIFHVIQFCTLFYILVLNVIFYTCITVMFYVVYI